MGVRAVETMTASRTDMGLLLGEDEAEPLGGEGGLVLALDLDGNGLADKQLARRLFVDPVQREMAAHALPCLYRGEETDPVEAVIDRHAGAIRDQHDVGSHAAKQGQAEEAVGDGTAEAGRGRGDGVDMDELVVVGRIGERRDAVPAHLEPARRPYRSGAPAG